MTRQKVAVQFGLGGFIYHTAVVPALDRLNPGFALGNTDFATRSAAHEATYRAADPAIDPVRSAIWWAMDEALARAKEVK